MVFQGINKERFRIEILGYYGRRLRAGASRRLLLLFHLTSADGGWATLNASVTKKDFQSLIHWLEVLSGNRKRYETKSRIMFSKKIIRFGNHPIPGSTKGNIFLISFHRVLGLRKSPHLILNGLPSP